MKRIPIAVAVLLLSAGQPLGAQEPAVSKHSEAVPSQIAAPLQGLIGAGGARVQIGNATLDIWWVKSVPLAAGGSGPAAWPQVDEGTLVGAIRIAGKFADVRGKIIKPGAYTLRFAWQPQNGDHLGVSPFREFLLLNPAAEDTDPKALAYEAAVELSKKASGEKHPAVLSLDPPAATEPVPVHSIRKNDEFSLTAVIFELPATRGGQAAGMLRFGLVITGVIEA